MKKVIVSLLSILFCSPCFTMAKTSSLMPKKEQAEDMRYYQQFDWNKKIERKAMYEAIANGQFHMFDKMSACQTATSIDLKDWLNAFNIGPEEVEFTESDNGMRDMGNNEIRDPDYGNLVTDWLVRDYAEQHYLKYTEENLTKMQNKFWSYCLQKLPIEPFTKAGKAKFEAKLRAEELAEIGYP